MKPRQWIKSYWWLGLGILVIAATMLATHLKAREQTVATSPTTVVVYKSPTCGCCMKWVEYLQQSGLPVEVHDEPDMALVKRRLGVPASLESCHTATIGGYVIEGHVPAEDIKRLLAQRPQAKGLAVPGMPMGSPGMEMGDRVDPYDVLIFSDELPSAVFARHGATSP